VLKVDLHIHTSDDPVDHIAHSTYELIDRAVSLGFGALAVTLHDLQYGDQNLRDYATERGIVLLPGVERTIDGKHVLLVNFPAEADRVRSFDEVRRLKQRGNGLVIAPHPFFPDTSCLRSRLEAHADLFDAVEWSYFWMRSLNFNARAKSWAVSRGKTLVGNSDLHDLRQLGRTYTWVSAEPDADAICEAVRAGQVDVHTAPVPPAKLVQVFGGMVLRGRKSSSHQLEVAREEPHAQLVRPLPGIVD
jgi:predicted metal-dependent phosphoesterase TrpH